MTADNIIKGACWGIAALLAFAARAEPAGPRWVQGVGYVEPASEVRRLAFKHPGIIGRCSKEIGQAVKQGEVLMEQHNAEEKSAVALAHSAVAVARAELGKVLAGINPYEIQAKEHAERSAAAELDYAQRNLLRIAQLAQVRHAAEAERDLAETDARRKGAQQRQLGAEVSYLKHYVRQEDRALAEARLAQAEQALDSAQRRLDETVLYAPTDGTVLEILHREGESSYNLGSADPVLLLGDLAHLRVRAEIDESYALSLKTGQAATIFGRGLGSREISARVTLVKPVMGKKTVFAKTSTERKDLDVIQVFLEPEPPLAAPVGMEVDVKIRLNGG